MLQAILVISNYNLYLRLPIEVNVKLYEIIHLSPQSYLSLVLQSTDGGQY